MMKKIGKKKIVIGILLMLCIITVIWVAARPDILVYNEDERTVYYKGNSDILLDEVINPEVAEPDKIIGIFMESKPYVGIYDIVGDSTEIVCSVDELSQAMGGPVDPEEIRNIQLIDKDNKAISFLYNQTPNSFICT